MLSFDFLKKGLGLASPPHCVYDFARKIFLMIYSINWQTFIVWLPLLLEILGNLCIVIICCPVCVTSYILKLTKFLIKTCFCITKKLGQKRKYLKNENIFQHEIKSIFSTFKVLSLKSQQKIIEKLFGIFKFLSF